MMLFREYVETHTALTSKELKDVERYLDAVFKNLGIDVEFTKHFMDRVNDARNGKQITKNELITLFQKEFNVYGKSIAQLGPDKEAVLSDLSSSINTPIALKWNSKNNVLDMVVKTVMRKRNFKPNNNKEKQYKVS